MQMLDYLSRKDKVLTSLKEGLTDKGYSFRILAGLNARLDTIKEIKQRHSLDVLEGIVENTNYPLLTNVIHGLDNVNNINDKKNNWYLYAINEQNMQDKDVDIMRESFLSKNTLIYIAEKSASGSFTNYYVIFSKIKYDECCQYINHKWQ
jgi:hypothetical protein